MNKSELITAIANECQLPKTDAEKALNAFIKHTTKTLKAGNKLALFGFGTFSILKRSARNGRNPSTGQPIKIPAKKIVKFKVGSELAKALNK